MALKQTFIWIKTAFLFTSQVYVKMQNKTLFSTFNLNFLANDLSLLCLLMLSFFDLVCRYVSKSRLLNMNGCREKILFSTSVIHFKWENKKNLLPRGSSVLVAGWAEERQPAGQAGFTFLFENVRFLDFCPKKSEKFSLFLHLLVSCVCGCVWVSETLSWRKKFQFASD